MYKCLKLHTSVHIIILDHDQFHKEEGSELPKEQLDAENLSSQSDEELSQSEPLLSKDSPQMSLNSNDLSLEGHLSGSWMESQENQCEDGMFVCVRAWVCEYVYAYIGGASVMLIDQAHNMYDVVCTHVLSYVYVCMYMSMFITYKCTCIR